MGWKVTAEATYADVESLNDLKAFMKVDESADDDLITFLFKAAARAIERYTQSYLLTQTWEYSFDIPNGISNATTPWFNGVRDGVDSFFQHGLDYIELNKTPVQSIESFKYYSRDNTENTLATSVYRLDNSQSPARVILNDGQSWPVNVRDRNSYVIQVSLGYGDAATDLPEDLRTALRAQVLHMYDNRGCGGEMKLTDMTKELLAPFVQYKY